jgi:hypothetical protein
LVKHDLDALRDKVNKLKSSTARLHDAAYADALLAAMSRPGWTTAAEYALVEAHVELIDKHLDFINEHITRILPLVNMIGSSKS